jgi:diguanylate cyclase (GGDEF)-like protein
MDIDDFKIVNDILGSDEADKLLKKIADEFLKLKGSFKIFSRFGGDEFLALIQPHEKEVIEDSIHQIQELFEQGFLVQEKDFKLKISIGVSFYNGNEISVDDMILRAELAMYQVKKAGKNGWRLYDNSLGTEYKEKNRIEDILKTALDEDGFRVVYQPQVDLKSGQIHSYEALIRLNEIDISPQRFIPIAEESDLILKIGRTVLEKAIVHLSKRKELGQKLKVVAVNFSSRQSRDDEYIPFLEHLLQQYSLDSKYIEIEITESILLQNDEEAKKLFSNFKRIGVNLVLDDFVSGYASLEYLTYIPITKLKISKELADKFFEEKKEETIKSIIALAHSLGLKITVEGIEKKWQLDFLKESGCDFIQGYIFSRPVDGKTVEKLEMINFLQEV